MKTKTPQFKPRLSEEARERLHKGSAHNDKRKYNRKRDKQSLRWFQQFHHRQANSYAQ